MERTDPAVEIFLGKCWWCGETADSREHRFKKRDIDREWGSDLSASEVVMTRHHEPGRRERIRGAKAGALKFSPSLCSSCNNARSQPFDRAYDRLTDWLRAHEDGVLASRELDFTAIFGDRWEADARDMGRYFVKHACCTAAEALTDGMVVLGEDIFAFLDGGQDWPSSLAGEFYIDLDRLLITDLAQTKRDSRSFLSVGDAEAVIHRPTGEIVGLQSRLAWRAFTFAWQLSGLDPRPSPVAEPRLALPAISALPAGKYAELRAALIGENRELAARRAQQGLLLSNEIT